MGQMYIENNRVIYSDGTRVETLCDYTDMISNYSRIPLQYWGDDADSLLNLILGGIQEHKELAAGTKEQNANEEYATVALLLAREHMKTPYELKVLEIGCTSGIMSYHLAKLIGKYNENSQLCCVTDAIGNESGNGWLDKIARLGCVPKLSFLATDYDCMPLADGYFDMVVINGSVAFGQKEAMLSEAIRVLKKGGVLIGYVVQDTDLIERIAYRCSALKVYSYLEDRCLLYIEEKDLFPVLNQKSSISYVKEEIVCLCEKMLEAEIDAEEVREMIRKMDGLIAEAGEKRDLDGKVLFMQYKGKLLDKLVRIQYKK